MPRRMFRREPRLALEAALKRAAQHVMTPAEIAAQRRSWVIGETMLERPEMTREQAVALYESIISPIQFPCCCEKGRV